MSRIGFASQAARKKEAKEAEVAEKEAEAARKEAEAAKLKLIRQAFHDSSSSSSSSESD